MLAAAYFRFEENEMSTTTIANPDEFMDAESFAELGEAAAANTVIDYMYRDGSNWKTGAQVIFAGRITRDEISMILNARYDDGWFIPGQVGMTDLQEGWDSQLDHPFHEICGFELTLAAPDDPREISQFVREFTSVKWKKRYRP